MPRFKFVSAKEIFARVIRNTGYKLPAQYHDDMLDWLVEGLLQLNTTNIYITKSTPKINERGALCTINHVVSLPCGFISILAVENEYGERLPEGGDITDLSNPSSLRHEKDITTRPTVFNVNPLTHQTNDGTPTEKPGTTIPIYGEDLDNENNQKIRNAYYKINGNYLQTSFETGFIRLHYNSLQVDSEGYPMVPDNENFKTALYWYILMMLIGSGFEHKVFNYQFTEQQFEKFGGRALGEIKIPSLDEKARIQRANTRLITPYRFYEDFFVGSEQPEKLDL